MKASTLPSSSALEIISERQTKDSLGRKTQTPRAECDAMVKDFEASGLTGAEYARRHDINYDTFCSRVWRVRTQKRRQASVTSVSSSRDASLSSVPKPPVAPAFQELRVKDAATFPPKTASSLLTVTLPGGIRVEGCDVATVVALAEAMKGGH